MGKAERAHRQPLPANCNLMGTGGGPLPILRRADCFQSVLPNLHRFSSVGWNGISTSAL